MKCARLGPEIVPVTHALLGPDASSISFPLKSIVYIITSEIIFCNNVKHICANLIASRKFSKWGTDDLKIDVSAGNLDVALVYSGDFFDAWYADSEGENSSNIETYSIYAPTSANNVFYDGMVIPITSQETELAYKFIDFMLDYENSYINTEAVGYCPTLQSVYDEIFSSDDWEDITNITAYNPALIVDEAKTKAEVYLDLGNEVYRYMENLYNNKIRFGN